MKKLPLLFGLLLPCFSGCSHSSYSQRGDVNPLALSSNSGQMSTEQASDFTKNLTRSFTEDGAEYTLTLNTSVFGDLVVRSVADGVPTESELKQLKEQVLAQRVRDFTCFTVSVVGDAAKNAEYHLRDLKNWKGLLYRGAQEQPQRLYFFPVVNVACAQGGRESQQPVTAVILTSNSGPVGVQVLSWSIDAKKATSPQLSTWGTGGPALTGPLLQRYDQTLPKDVPGVLGEGANGAPLKKLSSIIHSRHYADLLSAFPAHSHFSVWDDLSFSVLYFGYAKDTMEACDPTFVRALESLPHTTLPAVIGAASVGTLRDLQASRCAAVGHVLYARRGDLRDAILEITQTSVAEQLDSTGVQRTKGGKRSAENLAGQVAILVRGYQRSTDRCIQGERDHCTIADTLEKSLATYERADKSSLGRPVIEQWKRFQKIHKLRHPPVAT